MSDKVIRLTSAFLSGKAAPDKMPEVTVEMAAGAFHALCCFAMQDRTDGIHKFGFTDDECCVLIGVGHAGTKLSEIFKKLSGN